MKYWLACCLSGILFFGARAQEAYKLFRFASSHNCFPDTARDHGHVDGDGKLLPREGHYDDSSVLVVVPKGLRVGEAVDMVFWFHGWHNNIDTALQFYGLARQFAASGRNAVLVLPEAARNAADSYGGKMRREGMFQLLAGDVVSELRRAGVISTGVVAGRIALAGHSGAYSVIADILEHGGLGVDEVFLFDALYGRVDVFDRWAEEAGHHFVHWFTNTGYGPDKMSDTMMVKLRQDGIAYGLVEEASVNGRVIKENRLLFVHSPREHNVIINDPDDFGLLMRNYYKKRPQ
ncbi:MAG: hypothetical protein JST42_22595 [Bacteroidetes bacterium]|nr:hypothetical protein [Bacteroidota bacterium]